MGTRHWIPIGLLIGPIMSAVGAACTAPGGATDVDPDDRLVVAMSTFSEGTFLPWNGSTGRKFYLDTIFEYLVYLDPLSLEPEPGLAERWESSPDGRVHSLWLRPQVEFHGGWGELTAEDVKYTLDRMRDPSAIAGPSSPLRKAIARVDAPERYKVMIHLKEPDIDFIRGYLSNGLSVSIVCKRHLEQKGDAHANLHPIGTGAFELERQQKDVAISVVARAPNPPHWRVRPQFRQIQFVSAPEEFTRAAMVQTGEADLAPINYDSIAAMRKRGLRVHFVSRNWAPVIRLGGLNAKQPNPNAPWARREVRQALNYAIDKRAIVDTIFHGHATPAGADAPAPEWLDLPAYPYDPIRARRLLAAAGYPRGFPISIRTYTTNPGAELPIIAEAVALYWQAVGLRVSIAPTNWTSLRGAWTHGQVGDVAFTHRGLPFASTLAGLQASVMTQSLFSSYANRETDAQVAGIASALDPLLRRRLVRNLGIHLRDEAAAVYIAFAHEPYAASAKVGHWPALSQQGTNVDLITR
jgi:peptide/nickel transport system substrate-binding protein